MSSINIKQIAYNNEGENARSIDLVVSTPGVNFISLDKI